MQTIIITLSRDEIATAVENLLYKYGKGIEEAENFIKVYNTMSSRAKVSVDAHVIDDSWETRTQNAIDFIRDFNPTVTASAGSKVVSLSMSDRWGGSQPTLKAAMERYITDGMMNDWLEVTAPNEATIYGNRLESDEKRIKNIIYSLGKPAV